MKKEDDLVFCNLAVYLIAQGRNLDPFFPGAEFFINHFERRYGYVRGIGEIAIGFEGTRGLSIRGEGSGRGGRSHGSFRGDQGSHEYRGPEICQ